MIPAIIAAGASILGGVLANRSSAKQAAAANEMSWEQMNAQNQFNSVQSEVDWIRGRQSMAEANAYNLSNMEAAHNYQRFQNLEQMQFQDAQANKQMAFQERLANSQHQREVNDLRLAGLNPILSGTGGPGAAVAPGAMGTGHAGGPGAASVSAPSARGYGSGSASFQQGRVIDAIGPAVSSAIAAGKAVEEVKLIHEQGERTKAETIETLARARRVVTQADLDPRFAEYERQVGVTKTAEEAYKVGHEGRSAAAKADVDTGTDRAGGHTFARQEREAAIRLLENQASTAESTARSAHTKAELDERLSAYERLINMGEGATSALGNLVPRIRLWEGRRSRGTDFSLGR